MARPKSPDPASKALIVRLTPEQLAEVHRRAAEAGVTASELARRLLLATALVIGALAGCAPEPLGPPLEGNASVELLADEYAVVGEVTAHVHALEELEFSTVSWRELQDLCAAQGKKGVCAGWALRATDGPHGHLIHTVEPPNDRCNWQPMDGVPKYGGVYGHVVIHELLHAAHFEHGPEMQSAEAEAWELYQERHCQ